MQNTTQAAEGSILAIDTSSDACSVALSYGSETRHRYTDEPRKHAEWVLPMVDGLLSDAGISLKQLDAIAFARGPGSFTGLRIAAGVVQGLALGADLPVVPISTLAVLAHQGYRVHGWKSIMAALDARMGEVYWGCFHVSGFGDVIAVGEEQVCVPHQVQPGTLAVPAYGVGGGWIYQQQIESTGSLPVKTDAAMLPHATDLLCLAQTQWRQGHTVDATQVVPVYLRNNVAAKPMPPGK